MKPSAYVLIPVHNRKETTLRCLEHLRATGAFADCRVVVIDDGSTDGTGEAVAARFPGEVDLLPGNGDLWWTGAMVVGMRHALAQEARLLFWLNDDCLPDRGTLAAMIAFMEAHPGTLTAPVCYPEGRPEQWLATGFIGRHDIMPPRGGTAAVEGFSGYCVGMQAEVCRRIGLPDAEKFPHYAGDGMYTLTAMRAGFKLALLGTCAAALAQHDSGVLYISNLIKRRLGFRQAFADVFLHKRSRYYLKTRFFYSRAKYGQTVGLLTFVVRAIGWMIRFCAAWILRTDRKALAPPGATGTTVSGH